MSCVFHGPTSESIFYLRILYILEVRQVLSHALASQRPGNFTFSYVRQRHTFPLQCLPRWLGTMGFLWTLRLLSLSHHFPTGKLTSSESLQDSELPERTELPFPRLPRLAFTEAMGLDRVLTAQRLVEERCSFSKRFSLKGALQCHHRLPRLRA